jgi:SNF2 family DNA or RNA helicase
VILYDLAWNPVHDQQAVGRAYRLGQKKHVFVYRLGVYGTYEEIFFTENVFKLNLSKRVIDKQNPGRFGVSKDADLRRYFQIPKSDDAAVEIDKHLFEKKDKILDKLLRRSDSGDGAKILELDLTETFHKDEEETYLTAEDTLAANQEAEEEKRLREEGIFFESKHSYNEAQLARELFPESPERSGEKFNKSVPLY